MIRALVPMALLGVLGLLVPGESGAQAPPAAEPDTFHLVFDREVFNYPAYQRRNPFRPLTGNDAGPRFEEVRLLGVVLSSEPNGSVALLGPRGTSGRGGDAARTYRVRQGDVLGNMRITAIHRRELVVQVDEFGIVETRVMELRRTEPEAREADEQQDELPETPVDDPTTGPPVTDTIPSPPPGGGVEGTVGEPDTTRPPANGNGGSE